MKPTHLLRACGAATGRDFRNSALLNIVGLAFILTSATANAQTNTFPDSGNVGIGTTNPVAKLHVTVNSGVGSTNALRTTRDGGYGETNFAQYYYSIGDYGLNINSGQLVINAANGNVGIGTTNPGSYKLAVNGTIHAREVVVDNTGWPDYVFADSYRLAPLSEVEAHIKTRKHLPGIPSAAEVAAGGVSLGDMQARLLAKVEELTLHQIALEKRLAALEQENARLRQQP